MNWEPLLWPGSRTTAAWSIKVADTSGGAKLWRTLVGRPLDFGNGRLLGGSLELSNVDLSQEFIDMILAQTGTARPLVSSRRPMNSWNSFPDRSINRQICSFAAFNWGQYRRFDRLVMPGAGKLLARSSVRAIGTPNQLPRLRAQRRREVQSFVRRSSWPRGCCTHWARNGLARLESEGSKGSTWAHEISWPAIAWITSSRTVAFHRPVRRTQ